MASFIIGGFTGINLGSIFGFAGVLLPQLPDSIGGDDKGWIASTVFLGQIIGKSKFKLKFLPLGGTGNGLKVS